MSVTPPIPSPEPFLLHSWSPDFLAGKPDDLLKMLEAGEGAVASAILWRVGFAAFFILALANGPPVAACVVFLLILPLTAFSAYRAICRIKTNRRLVSDGEVLTGEIVRCTGRTTNTGGDDGSDYYEVTVEYRFRSPTGRELRGKDSTWREELEGAPLPLTGTPVMVLYLADRTYHLL